MEKSKKYYFILVFKINFFGDLRFLKWKKRSAVYGQWK